MDTVDKKEQNISPDQSTKNGSYFDGNTGQLIGYSILSAIVSIITLGIAYPWMLCMLQRWEKKHTVINGRRLKFNGKGSQLIGKWILWVFLTIITIGIYSIWLGLGKKKWIVKHTVYADDEQPVESYFSGGAGGYLGIHLLAFILTVFTLGIGKAWADKKVLGWEAKHTHIGGDSFEFNGKGGQLFAKYLVLVLLTPITIGIYALFFPVKYKKWQIKNTVAVCEDSNACASGAATDGGNTKEPREKKKASPLVWCVIAVVALLLAVCIIFSVIFVSAVNVPSRSFMGSRIVRIYSDSMSPAIKAGDLIYLDDDISNITTGDIIAFIYDETGAIAAHRIADVVTDDNGQVRYITKGDNNDVRDAEPVHPANIIGVYKHKASFIGIFLGIFAKKPATAENAYDWEAPLEGDGSEASPYIIANAYDLQKYTLYTVTNDEIYGTITASFEICTNTIYYANNESTFKLFQQQSDKGYLHIENEDIEVTYQGIKTECKTRIDQ